MIQHRLIERPAFEVLGRKTWIAGTDSSQFGRFWETCRADGLFDQFEHIGKMQPGAQTNGVTLGISRVEADPALRDFYYMIAIEAPESAASADLERYRVPACLWAVFECRGAIPDSIIQAEIYAFTRWLPTSGYVHANAPEMEVYPPATDGSNDSEPYCEFWLPVVQEA